MSSCFVPKVSLVTYAENKEKILKGGGAMKTKQMQNALRMVEEDPESVDIDFTTPIAHTQPPEDADAQAELVYEPEVHTRGKRKRNSSVAFVANSANEKQRQVKKQKKSGSSEGRKETGAEDQQQQKKEKSDFERLLNLRHRLQRIFLTEAGPRTEDFPRVDALLRQVEEFPVTFDLLKDTKIGKVIKRIANLQIENEPATICSRCDQLLVKWRELLHSISVNSSSANSASVVPEANNGKEEEEVKEEEEESAVLKAVAEVEEGIKATVTVEESVVVVVEKEQVCENVSI